MRLKSGFFVAALVRRAMGEGAFAAVTAKGSDDAGAIFVVVDRLDGKADLHAPAPQAMMEDRDADRRFETVLAAVPRFEVVERLERERRFDPDCWVVEIEDRAGRAFVDLLPPQAR